MQDLDLRALEIFRTVAAEGSVSRAAARLNRVQSNVSTRIKQLEEQFGKQLFVRHHKGLRLTADGDLLLGYAERFLQLSEEASNALRREAPRGDFRLGTMESTAAARLPTILSRYHALYPAVRIELVVDTAGGLVDRLRKHDVEAAFLAEPLNVDRLNARPVFEEKLMLVVPRAFPEPDDVGRISGKTVIAFEAGCAYRRYLEQWLFESGIVPGGIISVGSYIAILACVAAGTGYAVVPESVLQVLAPGDQVRCCALPAAYCRIATLLAWRDDYASAKLDALQALLP